MKKNSGLTLIELLIALVMSAIIIAALYQTFIGQQKTYTVQEQVVDMQQNLRVGINKMMREIRMAGFGNVSNVLSLAGGVNGFTEVITPNTDSITIVGGFKQIRANNGDPILVASASGNTITLNYQPKEDEFNTLAKRYISIGGVESNTVKSISEKDLTLDNPLLQYHPAGTPLFKIQAITYNLKDLVLGRDENTGGGPQPLADNIETLELKYFDDQQPPIVTAIPENIRMIWVKVTASMEDPDLKKARDGYRRRTITSSIQLRNMGLNQ